MRMNTSESLIASDDAGAAVSNRRLFPFRTLLVCFTIWLIATEVLIFDQIKFNIRIEALEQAERKRRAAEIAQREKARRRRSPRPAALKRGILEAKRKRGELKKQRAKIEV